MKSQLENAAFIALQKAGCLDRADSVDRQINDRAASAAEAKHQAWCRKTGSKF